MQYFVDVKPITEHTSVLNNWQSFISQPGLAEANRLKYQCATMPCPSSKKSKQPTMQLCIIYKDDLLNHMNQTHTRVSAMNKEAAAVSKAAKEEEVAAAMYRTLSGAKLDGSGLKSGCYSLGRRYYLNDQSSTNNQDKIEVTSQLKELPSVFVMVGTPKSIRKSFDLIKKSAQGKTLEEANSAHTMSYLLKIAPVCWSEKNSTDAVFSNDKAGKKLLSNKLTGLRKEVNDVMFYNSFLENIDAKSTLNTHLVNIYGFSIADLQSIVKVIQEEAKTYKLDISEMEVESLIMGAIKNKLDMPVPNNKATVKTFSKVEINGKSYDLHGCRVQFNYNPQDESSKKLAKMCKEVCLQHGTQQDRYNVKMHTTNIAGYSDQPHSDMIRAVAKSTVELTSQKTIEPALLESIQPVMHSTIPNLQTTHQSKSVENHSSHHELLKAA